MPITVPASGKTTRGVLADRGGATGHLVRAHSREARYGRAAGVAHTDRPALADISTRATTLGVAVAATTHPQAAREVIRNGAAESADAVVARPRANLATCPARPARLSRAPTLAFPRCIAAAVRAGLRTARVLALPSRGAGLARATRPARPSAAIGAALFAGAVRRAQTLAAVVVAGRSRRARPTRSSAAIGSTLPAPALWDATALALAIWGTRLARRTAAARPPGAAAIVPARFACTVRSAAVAFRVTLVCRRLTAPFVAGHGPIAALQAGTPLRRWTAVGRGSSLAALQHPRRTLEVEAVFGAAVAVLEANGTVTAALSAPQRWGRAGVAIVRVLILIVAATAVAAVPVLPLPVAVLTSLRSSPGLCVLDVFGRNPGQHTDQGQRREGGHQAAACTPRGKRTSQSIEASWVQGVSPSVMARRCTMIP